MLMSKEGVDKKVSDKMAQNALRQIVSGALTSSKVLDIFAVAGLDKPDISILSEDFLQEIK